MLLLRSYGFSWDGKNSKPNLGDYYLSLGDAVNEVCKSCIFLLEGTGQSNFLGVDWCARSPPLIMQRPCLLSLA